MIALFIGTIKWQNNIKVSKMMNSILDYGTQSGTGCVTVEVTVQAVR
jgi:hypothetical protein